MVGYADPYALRVLNDIDNEEIIWMFVERDKNKRIGEIARI